MSSDSAIIPQEITFSDTGEMRIDVSAFTLAQSFIDTSISLWENSTNLSKVLMLAFDVALSVSFSDLVKIVDEVFESKKIVDKGTIKLDPQRLGSFHTQYCMVFFPTRVGVPDFNKRQQIIYRSNFTAVENTVNLTQPPELNRRENTGAVLGPLVSLMWGQQEYIENLALISTIIMVGAEGSLREIQNKSSNLLKKISTIPAQFDVKTEKQEILSSLSEITYLENKLVMSTDVGADLFIAVPSLRPADFHRALSSELHIIDNRNACARIINRVQSVCKIRLDQIAVVEQRQRDLRSHRWAISVAIVSVLAVPFSIIFGYFSLKGSEPMPDHIFIDVFFYWKFYIAIATAIFVIAGLHFVLYIFHLRNIESLKSSRVSTGRTAKGKIS